MVCNSNSDKADHRKAPDDSDRSGSFNHTWHRPEIASSVNAIPVSLGLNVLTL